MEATLPAAGGLYFAFGEYPYALEPVCRFEGVLRDKEDEAAWARTLSAIFSPITDHAGQSFFHSSPHFADEFSGLIVAIAVDEVSAAQGR